MWPFNKKKERHGAPCTKCGSHNTAVLTKMQSIFTYPGGRRGMPRVFYLAAPDRGMWRCKDCKNIFKLDN